MNHLKTMISNLPMWLIITIFFLTAFSQQKYQIIISANVENAKIQFHKLP